MCKYGIQLICKSFIIALLSIHNIALANSESEFAGYISLIIGESVLKLPEPLGFIETSTKSVTIWKMAQSLTSGYSENIAHYISKDDFDAYNENRESDFTQYFLVQTSKSEKKLTITQKQFDKLRFGTVAAQDNLKKSIEPKLEKEMGKINKSLSDQIGKPIDIKFGQVVPISVNANRNNFLSYSIMARVGHSNPADNDSQILIITTGICYLKGKIISLNSYRQFHTPQDLQVSRDFMDKWANAMFFIN